MMILKTPKDARININGKFYILGSILSSYTRRNADEAGWQLERSCLTKRSNY